MNAKLLVLCLIVLAGSSGQSGPTIQTPMKSRPPATVTVKEREAMGVDPPTWVTEHGKVHPDVRTAIAREKETADDDDAYFKPGRPVGFLGMVYVAVHLKTDASAGATQKDAIKKVQHDVLSALTAEEFSCWLRFADQPVMLGFANEAGLEKLASHEKVVAIGPDNKPLPIERPKHFSKGVEKGEDGKLPKVSPGVHSLLEENDEIFVLVRIERAVDNKAAYDEKVAEAWQAQSRVLSSLLSTEFRTTSRMPAAGIDGFVTREGLRKLAEHPDVAGVGLEGPPPKRPGAPKRPSLKGGKP